MSGRTRIALGLLVLATFLAGGFWYSQNRSAELVEVDTASRTSVVPTETTQATRRDLSEELKLTGTLSYGDTTVLPIEADGLITSSPEADDILAPGDELLRVDNRPITLAEGNVPLYRELRLVGKFDVDEAGDKLGLQKGDDVEQLQRFLIDAEFDDSDRLEADGIFGISTERAMKAWQKDQGLPATGKVDRSQLVFIDGPIRIETAPTIGMRFDQVSVSAVQAIVQLEVSARQRPFFAIGTSVSVKSDAGDFQGTVTSLKRTTGADGTSRHAVEIEFTDAIVPPDIETVDVVSIRLLAEDVTTVPVRALVALAEGGWAVQVQSEADIVLTAVELGKVVDGIAEIDGLDDDTTVVVPS